MFWILPGLGLCTDVYSHPGVDKICFRKNLHLFLIFPLFPLLQDAYMYAWTYTCNVYVCMHVWRDGWMDAGKLGSF